MGRSHLNKLPNHLFLTPPPTPPTDSSYLFASSLLSVKSVVYPAQSLGFQDAYNARAVGDNIPGFRTSAAFFTTLRANLAIDLESPPPSVCNTPDLRPVNLGPSTSSLLPPPSPSPLSQVEEAPLAQEFVPLASTPHPFTTSLAATEDDKVDALHLIADSVVQQRQYAVMAMLSHPLSLITTLLILVIFYRRLTSGQSSPLTMALSFTGVLLIALGTLRLLTTGYIHEAESIGAWSWLEKGLPSTDIIGEDSVFLARSTSNHEVIGALILRAIRDLPAQYTSPNSSHRQERKRRQTSKDKNAPILGLIRGWTVNGTYRRQGIGTQLLEEAIRLCQQRGWQGPEVDAEHANSKKHLPAFFAGVLEGREAKTQRLLEKVKESMGVGVVMNGKRRR